MTGSVDATVDAVADHGAPTDGATTPDADAEGAESDSTVANDAGADADADDATGNDAPSNDASGTPDGDAAGTVSDAHADAPNDAAGGGCDACPPADKIVFITESVFTGDLGGLQGADMKCQQAATGHFPGTFMAWLSDSMTSAGSRLSHSPNRYVLPDGTAVANDWADLVDGTILHAIDMTETLGQPQPGIGCGGNSSIVWTDTSPAAYTAVVTFACNDWTLGSMGMSIWGVVGPLDSSWTAGCSGGSCGFNAALYCFQQ
jgi:hypothetical protein